jgi:hypothetical protein
VAVNRLPEIAHSNIFVPTHKNADEPATVAELWQEFVASCMAVVIGLSGKL